LRKRFTFFSGACSFPLWANQPTRKKNINTFLISFAALFISAIISAQAPSPTPSEIKTHHVKTIDKHISDKPDNQFITDKGLFEHNEYDSEGRLISTYITEIKSSIEKEVPAYSIGKRGARIPYTKVEHSYLYDTVFTFYSYDNQNRVTIKRSSVIGREIFKSNYYEYDEKGNVKKETVIREVNAAEHMPEFKAGMQTVLSLESFSYELLVPGQVKKKFFNDEGRVYKEGIIHYNEKNQVIEETFDFSVTWIKERNNYKYTDKGLLSDKRMTSNEGYSVWDSYEYEFDNAGTLTGLHIFSDGIKTNDIGYLYDKNTGLLQSEVNRDFKKSSIRIVRYDYGFYY